MDYNNFKRLAKIDKIENKESFYSDLYDVLNSLKSGSVKKACNQNNMSNVWSYVYKFDGQDLLKIYVARRSNYVNSLDIKPIIYDYIDEVLKKHHYRWSILGDGGKFIKTFLKHEFNLGYDMDIYLDKNNLAVLDIK